MLINHDYYLDKYLSLDKNAPIPFSVSLHIFFCKDCREQIRLFSKVEKLSSNTLLTVKDRKMHEMIPLFKDVVGDILKPKKNKKPIPLFTWILAGFFLLLAILLFTWLDIHESVSFFAAPPYIIIALCVSVFCILFIVANFDIFKKHLHKK